MTYCNLVVVGFVLGKDSFRVNIVVAAIEGDCRLNTDEQSRQRERREELEEEMLGDIGVVALSIWSAVEEANMT